MANARGQEGTKINIQEVVRKLGSPNKSDRYFGDLDLSGMDLSGLDFSKIWLDWTNLDGCNLSGTNMRGAILIGATARHAKLINADLTGATFWLTKFDHSNLAGADFCSTKGINNDQGSADFWASNCTNTKFERALLQSQFGMTNLTGANLSHARLEGSYIQASIFRNVNMNSANLCDAMIMGALDLSKIAPEFGTIPDWCQYKNPYEVVNVFDNVDFRGAKYNAQTLWNGIDPSKIGAIKV